jgi:alpha-L-fucosidase
MRSVTAILAAVPLVCVMIGAPQAFGDTTKDSAAENADTIYLSTSFRANGQDGLRFIYSIDGYNWKEVPGTFLKPRVGPSQLMRDPSLVRGPDGMFHLVWTTGWHTDQGFGYASSKDLVHWSEQRFIPAMAHEPTTANVWAPELFYDETNDQYIICWASTIPGRFPDYQEERRNNHRMYYATTRDFKTFTQAKLFFDPDFSIIDCTIVKVANGCGRSPDRATRPTEGLPGAGSGDPRTTDVKDGDRYVLVLKDNSRPERNLKVAFGDSPLGPWHDVSKPFTGQFTEGPTVLKIGDDWIIYFDAYRENVYGAVKTRDFKTFTDITKEVSFPQGHKHGTAFLATGKDLNRLIHAGEQQVPNTRQPFKSALSDEEIARRLAAIDEVAARGPFQPDWDSLADFQTPEWYRDAKFGIFIHWGAYSVPAFGNEWYPRNMYQAGTPESEHHVATYGPQSQFGYKDFIAQFKAESFDADRWAKLLKEAGAKYVIPVAEHHDGFPMYDSDCTEWCAARKGPCRDVIGQLAAALRKKGIVVGASSHRAEHWWFFDQGMYFDSDVRDPANAALYGPASNQRMAENQSEPPDKAFLDDWLLRSCEIVDKDHPQVMYFDWWIGQPAFQPYLKRFAAYYYNRGVEWDTPVAINFKEWEGRSFPDGTGVFDIERGHAADIRPELWQTCTSVSKNSWGYVENQQYKQVGDIVDNLVDIVSKNGTMLLNIGPKSDGTIPEHEQQVLRAIGSWLRINGEAIYGTRPWKRFGEGPIQVVAGSFADVKRQPFTSEDIRFTTKDGTLYAIALAWPNDGKLVVKSLAPAAGLADGRVTDVRLLGYDGTLDWRQTEDGLVVTLPNQPPCDYAVTLAITGIE